MITAGDILLSASKSLGHKAIEIQKQIILLLDFGLENDELELDVVKTTLAMAICSILKKKKIKNKDMDEFLRNFIKSIKLFYEFKPDGKMMINNIDNKSRPS